MQTTDKTTRLIAAGVREHLEGMIHACRILCGRGVDVEFVNNCLGTYGFRYAEGGGVLWGFESEGVTSQDVMGPDLRGLICVVGQRARCSVEEIDAALTHPSIIALIVGGGK